MRLTKPKVGRPSTKDCPKFDVSLPDRSVRKFFNLKEASSSLLQEYSSFLSEHHKCKVHEDLVIESLITKLRKDKSFKAWRERASA